MCALFYAHSHWGPQSGFLMRPRSLLWAILIREKETKLSTVTCFSRILPYFCTLSLPAYTDIDYHCLYNSKKCGRFLVRARSSSVPNSVFCDDSALDSSRYAGNCWIEALKRALLLLSVIKCLSELWSIDQTITLPCYELRKTWSCIWTDLKLDST